MHTDPKTRLRPLLRKQPDVIEVFSAAAKGFARGGIVNKRVQPPGGEPGRPWRRQMARALYEDQQRKKPRPAKVIVGTLPKATKLDRGSLAAYKNRGPQRLGFVTVRAPALTPHVHASRTA